MPLRLRLLVAATVAGGGAIVTWHLRLAGDVSWGGVAIMAAAFLSGLLIVELSNVSAESVTFALVAAALIGDGPTAAVLAAAAGEVGSALRPPVPKLHRSAYNVSAHIVAAAALGWIDAWAGAAAAVPVRVLIATAGGLVYFGISSGLVAAAIGWSTKAQPLAVWSQAFRWLAPHYAAFGLAGFVLATVVRVSGPAGVLVFLLPLLMSHYSVWIFVRRTREQMQQLESANRRLASYNAELTEALASVVDARDLYLFRHSHQASAYSERIARRLALPEDQVRLVRQGALLHDIGKVGIPEAILRKPGPLSEAERSIMNRHAAIGASIVARTSELTPVAAIIRAHHERFDGRGYPDGLAGDEIPVGARILSVLEAFDAMISDRPYRAAMSVEDALAEIGRCSGSQFDPRVVRAFLSLVEEEGSDWLHNSAAGAHVTGTDLFLPLAERTGTA
ncbi:MAG TPA: HD-GYP domain-containing protein [Actinomycetota bacterium]|nr:HD-GYP domain-containing protein [Actinomycetota bacterium]